MARIRSVHPGLFSDEAFVSVSPQAQVFLIGLWTECDDNGAFEWKPLTLKMRLLPASPADTSALLSELEAVNSIRKVEIDGRHYGYVRNFRKYQRPKFPKETHPITDDLRKYVGLTLPATEIDRDDAPDIPRKGETAAQMEDGGGSRSSDPNGSGGKPPDVASVIFHAGLNWLQKSTGKPEAACRSLLGKWRKEQGDEALIAVLGGAQREGTIDAVAWIEGAFKARRANGPRPRITPLGVGG